MNKTVSINIGGQFFHIDEDAFQRLDNYINAIKQSINTEGKDEIIADIENRIAELFHERIQQPNGVIRNENVEQIISIMGQPEDYIIEDEPRNQQDNYTYSDSSTINDKGPRKMYRNPDQKILGGVCSGIGHYFNVDPVWIRILFIVLVFFYGVSFLIYPILWIIIPKAVTPSQILEMKGIPVNINNIEKEVRESLGKYIDGSKKVINTGTNYVKKFIGITLMIFSVTGILGSGFSPIAMYKSNGKFPLTEVNLQQYLDIPISTFSLGILLFLCFALPFFILLILGIRLVYSKMKYSGPIIALLGILWLVCIGFMGYLVFQISLNKDKIEEAIKNYSKTEITNKTDLLLSNQDTLVLNFINDKRLYANDTLSNTNFITSDKIVVQFSQSTINESYVEIEETRFMNTSTQISINGGQYKIQTDKIPTALPFYIEYTKPVLNLSKNILSNRTDDSYENTEDIDIDSDINKVKVNVFLKEGQLVKLNKEDDRYFYEHLENGIQVYRMTNGSLVPTRVTEE